MAIARLRCNPKAQVTRTFSIEEGQEYKRERAKRGRKKKGDRVRCAPGIGGPIAQGWVIWIPSLVKFRIVLESLAVLFCGGH